MQTCFISSPPTFFLRLSDGPKGRVLKLLVGGAYSGSSRVKRVHLGGKTAQSVEALRKRLQSFDRAIRCFRPVDGASDCRRRLIIKRASRVLQLCRVVSEGH